MQVTLKTLQQQTFKIDIDPEETVRAEGSAGPGRARWGRGEHEGSAGPGRGAARQGAGSPPQLRAGLGGAPERGQPPVHRESWVCVGPGPPALDAA